MLNLHPSYRLDQFYLSTVYNGGLRKILMFWQAKITNRNLFKIRKTTDMRTLLRKYRWRWISHVLRNPTNNITRVALIKDEPQRGKGGKADQKHHGGTVEKELKDMNLTWGEVERMAKNREEIPSSCHMCLWVQQGLGR